MSKEMSTVTNKEPLMHISKRDGIETWKSWLIRIIAVLLSLVVCAGVIVALTGLNPIEVYKGIFDGAIGTKRRAWMTIRDTLVLLCIAVGITPAFKMRFWNIGAEGQVLIGGVTSAAMMIYLGNSLPPVVLFPLMFLGSAAAAMIWGVIPAFFKAYWNTNETLFTLMMNYVATQVITYCIIFWENPKGSNSVGTINSSTKGGWIPQLFGLDYGWNLVIVLALTVAMFIYLKYSKQGYEIAVVGESENTARYAGINVKRVILRTMALSGAICGIAGFIIVGGASHTISTSTAGGRGFTAIIVSWLSKFNTFVMILVSFFLVFMQKGAGQIASQFNLNENASDIITGIILCIPGMMYMGGIAGLIGAFLYENSSAAPNGAVGVLISFLCAFLCAALGGLIYSVLTITLRANQNVTGLALTTFGVGFGNFFGGSLSKLAGGVGQISVAVTGAAFKKQIPVLSGLGAVGQLLFSYGFLTYLAIILALVLAFFLSKTKKGLNLRAVGESPATADAAGINVTVYKYLATCIGGGISGLGGLYFVMEYSGGTWTNNGFGDRGWLAIALVIFALWKPVNAIWGSILFGGLYILYLYIPGLDRGAQEIFKALPYVVTIIVLVFTSLRKKREYQPPASLGLAYFREER